MSIAGDLLTTTTPARLLCRRGTWILELVKLVPVDRNVFQPRVQRLEGSEAVLQHLKRNADNPALAAAANQLMRGIRPDEDRSFEAVDGDWVPGEPAARRDSARPSGPAPAAHVAGELAELRAELLILRASHERLRERVMSLESRSSASCAPTRELISIAPTPSLGLPHISEVPRGAEPFVATLVQGRVPSAAEPKPNQRAAAGGVKLPTVAAINACLQALIGTAVTVRETLAASFSEAVAGRCWVSRLIDDEGHEVGAIVADLQATTALGGAVLSLGEAEIEAQRAAHTASEDVIAAMSEVANNLSGAINQEPGKTQVHVTPIEPLAIGLLDWAKAPSQALCLEVEADAGRLFLLAR